MQYFLKNFEFGKTRMRWKCRATTQGCPYVVTSRLLARKAPLARPVRRLVPLPKKSHDFSGTPLCVPLWAFPLRGRWVLPQAKLGWGGNFRATTQGRPYGFTVFVIIFRDDADIVPYKSGKGKPFPYKQRLPRVLTNSVYRKQTNTRQEFNGFYLTVIW